LLFHSVPSGLNFGNACDGLSYVALDRGPRVAERKAGCAGSVHDLAGYPVSCQIVLLDPAPPDGAPLSVTGQIDIVRMAEVAS
jgi:hypothetical protein